jgi:hypothetical protein
MPTNVIVVLGILLLVSIIGFVVAWIALTPASAVSKDAQLELSLKRIEREARSARELVRQSR